jgi:hypothetical protein
MKSPEKKRHTAFHEAAHAVIGFRLDLQGYELSIKPDNTKGTDGRHVQEEWDGTAKSAHDQIIAYLAGGEADRIAFGGEAPLGTEDDDQKAADLLPFAEGESLAFLRIEAIRLIEKNWDCISAIAEELLRATELSYDEWSVIVEARDEGKDWKVCLSELRTNRKMMLGR